jgi:hypothetical protein
MTAHWISVKDRKWKLKSAVIGFKALSGGHSGENLGRYSVDLLDRKCLQVQSTRPEKDRKKTGPDRKFNRTAVKVFPFENEKPKKDRLTKTG